jgi:hypothetical protein
MMTLKRGSVRDLLWNFARAEFEVPESGVRHVQPRISSALRERVARDERAALSGEDWEALREAVLSTRSDPVRPLLDLDLDWFLGKLPAGEWGSVRVMNLQIFTRIAPGRQLSELASALDAGAVPSVWSPSNYSHLRSTFDRSLMHGDPILVARRRAGPYTLIEGTTRMCVLLSKTRHGEIDIPWVPIVLGVSPRLSQWEFF